jgi:hypothetical protein
MRRRRQRARDPNAADLPAGHGRKVRVQRRGERVLAMDRRGRLRRRRPVARCRPYASSSSICSSVVPRVSGARARTTSAPSTGHVPRLCPHEAHSISSEVCEWSPTMRHAGAAMVTAGYSTYHRQARTCRSGVRLTPGALSRSWHVELRVGPAGGPSHSGRSLATASIRTHAERYALPESALAR